MYFDIKSLSLFILMICFVNCLNQEQYNIRMLKSDDENKVLSALYSIQKSNDKKYLSEVIKLYWITDNPKIKNEVISTAYYLAATKKVESTNKNISMYEHINNVDTTVIPILIDAIRSENNEIKIDAIGMIASLRDSTFEINILKTLEEKNYSVRVAAINALSKVGTKKSIPFLINMIKTDTTHIVKYNAILVLGKLADKDTAFYIQKNINEFPEDYRARLLEITKNILNYNSVI